MSKTIKAWVMFPRRLKSAMFKKGKQGVDLARETGISSNTISKYANGKAYPRIDFLELICEALDVSADWLMGRTDKMEGSNAEDRKH